MLEKGESYLIKAKTPQEACPFFVKHSKNCLSLIVSRTAPKKICKELDGKHVKFIWLTHSKTDEEHTKPHEVEQISYDIENFMRQYENSIIFFTGIEYMMSFTSFKEVYHLIQNLKDVASQTGAILVCYIGIKTLDEKEENLIEQELTLIGGENEKS